MSSAPVIRLNLLSRGSLRLGSTAQRGISSPVVDSSVRHLPDTSGMSRRAPVVWSEARLISPLSTLVTLQGLDYLRLLTISLVV